ncbi:hypothetical protein FPOAC2_04508 [Fusarium poae]|uniref:hypothetical protein n=1 Tax=Fusarium poae TaxID=36050 RepID=UPI001CE71FD9|nr:hypothetical protein FPOAC1_004424 [Fusarium poae]KAG8671185.1 hypothetical protein FPOAC1_004424 [Fusarium poae]
MFTQCVVKFPITYGGYIKNHKTLDHEQSPIMVDHHDPNKQYLFKSGSAANHKQDLALHVLNAT